MHRPTTDEGIDPDDFEGYSGLAWIYSSCSEEKYRDGKQAVKHATTACELNEWKNESHIAILAAAHAEAGEWDKAIQRQRQYIQIVKDAQDKQDGKQRLELYKSKMPFRFDPNQLKHQASVRRFNL